MTAATIAAYSLQTSDVIQWGFEGGPPTQNEALVLWLVGATQEKSLATTLPNLNSIDAWNFGSQRTEAMLSPRGKL